MQTILLILIVLLALRLLFQWIVPLVLPFMLKRFLKRHGPGFEGFNPPIPETPKEKQKTKKNNVSGNDDEYIDFEEVQ